MLARNPDGVISVHKFLSDNPGVYSDAGMEGIRRAMGLASGEAITCDVIGSIKMGTTLATNALLERKGVRVGFLVTKGFADILEIGYQDRPELFALNIRKPETLTDSVIEIDERVLADGTVRKGLDEDEVRAALEEFRADGIDALAVLLIHGFAYPEHEQRIGQLAQEAEFTQISFSHEVAREIKAVGRGGYDGCGCVFDADSAGICWTTSGGAGFGCITSVHAVERRADKRGDVQRKERGVVGACWGRGCFGACGRACGIWQNDRFRHGRHVYRCESF